MKNVIFDFGNVLFDLDLPSIEREFRQLFAERYETAFQALRTRRVFELYETGGMGTDEFVEAVRRAGGEPYLTERQVVDAWNSIFIAMPKARFEFLLRLRQTHAVFLLSNINDLHERWIADYMQREHGIVDYQSRYFDGVYFSHLIRLRKPDRDIYEYVLADAELNAADCVFFDDLPENIEAARAVGIQGVWHPLGTEIIEHCERVIKG
jgi:putative hydrolase of the HAD superfamily